MNEWPLGRSFSIGNTVKSPKMYALLFQPSSGLDCSLCRADFGPWALCLAPLI